MTGRACIAQRFEFDELVGTPSLIRRTGILVEQVTRWSVFRDAFRLLQLSGTGPEQVSKAEIEAIIVAHPPLGGNMLALQATTGAVGCAG